MPITRYFIWKSTVAFLLWFLVFAKVKLFLLKCILLYHTLNSSIPSYLPINRQINNCTEYLLFIVNIFYFAVRYQTLEFSQGAFALNIERKKKYSLGVNTSFLSVFPWNVRIQTFSSTGQFCCLLKDNENCARVQIKAYTSLN